MEKQGTKLVPAGFEYLFLGEVKTWAKENGGTHPSDRAWWHYQMYLENRKLQETVMFYKYSPCGKWW